MSDADIRKTLKDILEYIGGDAKQYANNAQLITYLEWLIKRHGGTVS